MPAWKNAAKSWVVDKERMFRRHRTLRRLLLCFFVECAQPCPSRQEAEDLPIPDWWLDGGMQPNIKMGGFGGKFASCLIGGWLGAGLGWVWFLDMVAWYALQSADCSISDLAP